MDDQAASEALKTMAAYFEAYNACDMPALDRLVQYPLAQIGNGKVTIFDSFPFKPADLKARTQWNETTELDYDVAFASREKAHIVLRRAALKRADGTTMGVVSGFYALTCTPSGWKIFAMSGITTSA